MPQILTVIAHRRSKRPLVRPPIASPYANASQRKVVYVSAKTPFISATKRVRKLLSEIEKRTLGQASLLNDKSQSDKQKLKSIAVKPSKPEAVYLRATGRAIEKGLNLALYFQNQQDCRIELKTGTVGTVDDIVENEESASMSEEKNVQQDCEGGPQDQADKDDLPETQLRRASYLEVAVWLT